MWPLLLSLLLAPTARATPNRVGAVMLEGTEIPDLSVAIDGSFVAFVETGSSEVRILDTGRWETDSTAPCVGADPVAVAVFQDNDGARTYVGCSDGSVVDMVMDGASVASISDPIDTGADEVLGLATTDLGLWIVVSGSDGGNPKLLLLDVVDDTLDSSVEETLGHDGYVDMDAGKSWVAVIHGGDNVSKIAASSGAATIEEQGQTALDGLDVVVSPQDTILVIGGEVVAELSTSTNDLSLVIGTSDGLDAATAAFVYEDDEEFVVADGGRGEFVFFPYSASSGQPGNDEQDSLSFPDEAIEDEQVREFGLISGYAVAGTSAGSLWILTDRPWVEASDPSPSFAIDGDEITVDFTSDTAGDWELRLSGDSTSVEILDSGTITADGQASATFTVDSRFVEGINRLEVVVDADGYQGHDVVLLDVDNPPSKVSLNDDNLGFGNAQLTLSFDGITDEDLDYYQIYLTVTPFERADWDSGGPEFDGTDSLESADLQITAEPGAHVTKTLSPLTNGVTYYLAVRAHDLGGQEGEMSTVVSETPAETFSSAEMAGEEGGICGTPGRASAALAGLGLLIVGLRRRRGAALAALCLATLALPRAGMAKEKSAEHDPARRQGGLQLRYGPINLKDSSLTDVFGTSGNQVFWLEAGPSIGDILEFTAGLGFFQEMGWLVSEDGRRSDEHDMLTVFPITVNATARLDFLDEQVLVPYGSAGGDFWPWRENWYESADVAGTDSVSGAKLGWHWAAGGQLLLDVFEPSRASRLQARTGIDDSYLTFEYRQQQVGNWQTGLRFTGSSWSLGLKFNY